MIRLLRNGSESNAGERLAARLSLRIEGRNAPSLPKGHKDFNKRPAKSLGCVTASGGVARNLGGNSQVLEPAPSLPRLRSTGGSGATRYGPP